MPSFYVKYSEGICCGCQSPVPLKSYSPTQEEFDSMDFPGGRECVQYVTVEHEFCGEPCEGSGQCPQVVLRA
jgi:hypothetical protein